MFFGASINRISCCSFSIERHKAALREENNKINKDILFLMDMRATRFCKALIFPSLCQEDLHRQITSCGLPPLHRQTLQRVSIAEGKQLRRPYLVRASSSPEYESGSGNNYFDLNFFLSIGL